MITPMSKVQMLIFHRSRDAVLSALAQLGMVHIDLVPADADAQLIDRARGLSRARAVTRSLGRQQASQQPHDDIPALVNEYESLSRRVEELRAQRAETASQVERQRIWGDFDPARLLKLADVARIRPRLTVVPARRFRPEQWACCQYIEVGRVRGKVYLLICECGTGVDLAACGAEEAVIPEERLSVIEARGAALAREEAETAARRDAFVVYRAAVERYIEQEAAAFDFTRVAGQLPRAIDGAVFVLTGWIPRTQTSELEAALAQFDAAYTISRPDQSDQVPVLLANSRFSRLFEPITRLFDLPAYRELDLTPLFAPFFVIFFSLCLGDAGYGVVLCIAGMIAWLRLRRGPYAGLAVLVAILGAATIAAGIATGTFFGMTPETLPLLKPAAIFNQDRLFVVALMLGLIQVLFGMGVKAINYARQFGVAAALPTIGWLLLVTGGLGWFGAHLAAGAAAVVVGVLLILFCNDLKAGIFMRLGKGLWELYGITTVFGDVLSYVRLFALGLSSAILGFVVNEIAMQFRAIPWVGLVLALVFLVVGHGANLLVSALSSFVHPLRLTFVEFYRNAGFTGGGAVYRPFGGQGK